MTYRDERDALRARLENLEEKLAAGSPDSADHLERALRPDPRRRRARFAVAAAVIATVGAAAGVSWVLSKRAATRAVDASWSQLSGCLIGEPLAAGEKPAARVRRIQLAYAFRRDADGEGPWPARCQEAAHRVYLRLKDDGRAAQEDKKTAYWAESLAARLKQGIADEELPPLLDRLWQDAEKEGIAPATSTDAAPLRAATPLHLSEIAGAAITSVDTPISSIHLEALPGPDRHFLIDAPQVQPAILCTVGDKAEPIACRPVPGDAGSKRGLRLLGTTDSGAAPLLFAGQDGTDGIYRSDTGERVAAVRAHSGYSAASGHVAIQTWPSEKGGRFDILEQRQPGAAVTTTTVKPEAQTQPVTTIHRSRMLWDKVVVQLVDEKNLDRSPWLGYRTIGKEGMDQAFHRAFDLNWVNTVITGCRGTGGSIVRVGPSEAFLVFNEGDTWRGPLPANGLGELRCDGPDAVFLGSWPPVVKRCTPAGCTVETGELGSWPSSPRRGMSAVDFADGKVVAAWATERDGVRVRVATAQQIGNASDIVVFDDITVKPDATIASDVSGLRLVAAGRSAVLVLATSAGIRAIRIGNDGSFAPANIGAAR